MTVKAIFNYLKKHELVLTTAESCTAGRIIHLLAKLAGSGECLDAGFVVYSETAKIRLLDVKQATINTYTLTSEEVAREMVAGAAKGSPANVIVSTTGIAGSKPMDGIPPGTICFAWGFKIKKQTLLFSETKHFTGTRTHILTEAAKYALQNIPHLHQSILKGDVVAHH